VLAQGGTGSFSGVTSGRGGYAVPSHLLVPWSAKCKAIPILPLRYAQSVSACTRGFRVFPVVNNGRGLCRPLTSFSAVVKNEYSYTSTPLTGCTEPQCLYKALPGISPWKIAVGLYAVSSQLLVPWSRKSIALPLNPLRLLQSVSPSKRGYRVFPRGKYRPGCYAVPSQLLVPWSRKVTAIALHLLRSVQSFSACTRGYRVFPRGK